MLENKYNPNEEVRLYQKFKEAVYNMHMKKYQDAERKNIDIQQSML